MDTSNPDPASLVYVDRATLQQLAVKLLQRKGMFAAEAEIVAERMIEADLRQRPADGTGSLAEYLEAMDLGDIDPRARTLTVSETPAIAVLDGSTGMGHVAATRAMLMCVEKAIAVGTGCVSVRNSRLCGDLGGIVRLAANQGLIGLITTSFDEGESGAADEINMAWAIPAPDGAVPLVERGRSRHPDGELSILCSVLSAGLAGADPHPRKRKAVRVANTVEYGLMAVSPDKFGTRDAFHAKWKPLWSNDAATGGDPAAATTVPLQSSVAGRLAELAAKTKFAVSW
jgi:LDH2 family malate/lactate/ureidoglycolate dehydrogenase